MNLFLEKNFDYSEPDIINLVHCGIREKCYGHRYDKHTHDNCILTLINEGNAKFNINGKETVLRQNCVYAMHSKSGMSYVVEENTPWSISWIVIEGKQVDNILDMLDITRENPFFYLRDPHKIREIYNEIFEKINRVDITSKMECISLLYRLFAALSEEKTSVNANGHIDRALEYIHENYSKNIGVCELADHLSLNSNYLSKLFKKTTGMTPVSYINALKLKKAKYLLKHTSMTVNEISEAVGYTDQFYFSRVFKKAEKLSPLNYRHRT